MDLELSLIKGKKEEHVQVLTGKVKNPIVTTFKHGADLRFEFETRDPATQREFVVYHPTDELKNIKDGTEARLYVSPYSPNRSKVIAYQEMSDGVPVLSIAIHPSYEFINID